MFDLSTVKKNEYLIVKTVKETGGYNKPRLIKVISVDDLTVVGRLEKDPHIKEIFIEAKASEVLVNLGKKPSSPGSVYGYNLSKIYHKTKEHDAFGDIHFFTEPDEKNLQSFWKGLDKAAAILKKHGLGCLITKSNFVFEVVPKHGKYSGMYIHSRNFEKFLPRLQLSVSDDTMKTASKASYTYVILHELAHVMDFQFLDTYPELNSAWLNLYVNTIGPKSVSKDRCQELLNQLISSEATLKPFISELDDETKAEMRLIFKWIREIKNITTADLDTLLMSRSKMALSVLTDTWPNVNIRSKKLKPVVTEYACKSRRELFAESVAFYLLDQELPPKISSLVEKSINQAKGFAKSIE